MDAHGGWRSYRERSVASGRQKADNLVRFMKRIRCPAGVAFAPDGRLFIADDNGNAIYYVAPETLRAP
jgi:glucose/arabinose dehydrogenase